MPIQFRPFSRLPWIPILNARTLKPGQTVTVSHELTEGTYSWSVTQLHEEDTAKVSCTLPYRYHSHQLDLTPITGIREIKGKEIEQFGPGTSRERHFRYIPGRRK